jgi:hypothetical protein
MSPSSTRTFCARSAASRSPGRNPRVELEPRPTGQAGHVEQHAATRDAVARGQDVVLQRTDALHVAGGVPVVHRLVDEHVAQRIDVRRRHAVERDADEVERSLETGAERRARVARDDHVVQRGCGFSTDGWTGKSSEQLTVTPSRTVRAARARISGVM